MMFFIICGFVVTFVCGVGIGALLNSMLDDDEVEEIQPKEEIYFVSVKGNVF